MEQDLLLHIQPVNQFMTTEQKQLLEFLLLQYMDGKSSPDEERQLFSMLRSSTLDRAGVEELIEELMSAEPEFVPYRAEEWQKVLKSCMETPVEPEKTNVVTKLFINRWVAAAVIISVVLGGIWLLKTPGETAEPVSKIAPVHDVSSPVTSAAVITLSNGKKVFLDSTPEGLVMIDDGVKLVKLPDGEWVYEFENMPATPGPVSYNTITNPKGSPVVNLSLSDGTKVWLNTGSSMTYPTSFAAANERMVEVKGEAYFEVSHNELKPFIVNGPGMQVQVLGTHFNINNYEDEPNSVITLLEGSVKVTKDDKAVLLKPGQQASVINSIPNGSKNSDITVINDADLKSVIAWKNGLFDFNNAHIAGIARQLARWYNVDVVFPGKVPERHYTGAIRKSVNLSEVIRMIELAGGVKLTINNKTMIVEGE